MMDGEQLVQLLWECYRAAEIRGRGGEKRTRDGEIRRPQTNYSLLWFYVRSSERLNAISRAFLGDAEALRALDWSAAPPEGWEAHLLEGRPLNEYQRQAVRSALDNIQEKIEEIRKELEELRGGGRPNRRWLQRHFARLGNAAMRQSFQDPRPGEGQAFQFSDSRVKIPKDGENGEILWVKRERSILAEDFLRKYPIVASTIHSLKNCFKNGPEYLYDYVIMDEFSQTDAVAGLAAMSCAKHLVLVGDPKQLPPVIPDSFVQEMEALAAQRGWDIPPEHAAAQERRGKNRSACVFSLRSRAS